MLDETPAIRVVETAEPPEGEKPATTKIAHRKRCRVVICTVT